MDIAALLENHRKHMLDLFESDDHMNGAYTVAAAAHDRATTKTLLDLYRQGTTSANGEAKPVGQAASVPPPLPLSRAIKPGSKRAKDRARKAVETKRRKAADEAAKAQGGAATTVIPGYTNPEGGAA